MTQSSRRWLFLIMLIMLVMVAGCATPSDPTVSPLRLPTRIPRTPTPTVAATLTPFSVSAWAYYMEGETRRDAGDAEGAIQSFTWAIRRAPNFALAYVSRGSIYLARQELPGAITDADAAIAINSIYAPAYALRGESLRLLGFFGIAQQAFERAIELDPGLKPATFRSRWLVTRANNQAIHLLTLSNEYADTHHGDPLYYYYYGWGFFELGRPHIASKILIEGIADAPDPPAVMWFALGQAYAANYAWQDAIIAFEAARALVEAGDVSLNLHSDQPIITLFDALGRAYLGAGRCVDAEIMLTHVVGIGATAFDYDAILEAAHTCQTPTPEATPYPTTTPG